MGTRDYSKYLQYYPQKAAAIKEYRLDTGASLREAKDVMDIVFARYKSTGQMVQIPAKFADDYQYRVEKPANHTGLRIGCGLSLLGYLLFGPIIVLTKKYMGKK